MRLKAITGNISQPNWLCLEYSSGSFLGDINMNQVGRNDDEDGGVVRLSSGEFLAVIVTEESASATFLLSLFNFLSLFQGLSRLREGRRWSPIILRPYKKSSF